MNIINFLLDLSKKDPLSGMCLHNAKHSILYRFLVVIPIKL